MLQSPLLCPFKQTIEAKNITIGNLMFLMSDASNKKIFTLLSYTEDFRSEAERIRLLNFHSGYSCEMFACILTYVCPAITNPAKPSRKQSKLRISYEKNKHKFKRSEPLKNCAV